MKRDRFYVLLLSLLIFFASPAFPQPGIDEMKQASIDLDESFILMQVTADMLAVILGTIAAVKIFNNWQMGKPHITNEIAAWFFATLFMTVIGGFLRALLGV